MQAEKGEEPDDEEDFGEPDVFYGEINYVIRTWRHYNKHGHYPNPGGYDDQDAELMADWHTMDLYDIRIRSGITSRMRMPTSADSWLSGMEG